MKHAHEFAPAAKLSVWVLLANDDGRVVGRMIVHHARRTTCTLYRYAYRDNGSVWGCDDETMMRAGGSGVVTASADYRDDAMRAAIAEGLKHRTDIIENADSMRPERLLDAYGIHAEQAL